jgi:hypothetical protein
MAMDIPGPAVEVSMTPVVKEGADRVLAAVKAWAAETKDLQLVDAANALSVATALMLAHLAERIGDSQVICQAIDALHRNAHTQFAATIGKRPAAAGPVH